MLRLCVLTNDAGVWKGWFSDWPMLIVEAGSREQLLRKLEEMNTEVGARLDWQGQLIKDDRVEFAQIDVNPGRDLAN